MKKILVGSLLFSILLFGACSSSDESTSNSNSSGNVTNTKQSSSEKKTETTGDFVDTAADAYFDGTMLKGNTYSIRITSHRVIQPGEQGNEYGDNPVIAFWYDTIVNPDYDNSNPISPNTAWILNFTAVQDNDPNLVNKLRVTSLPDVQYLDSQSADIKPGGSVSNAVAYELSDSETPVQIIAGRGTNDDIGSAEFQLTN